MCDALFQVAGDDTRTRGAARRMALCQPGRSAKPSAISKIGDFSLTSVVMCKYHKDLKNDLDREIWELVRPLFRLHRQ